METDERKNPIMMSPKSDKIVKAPTIYIKSFCNVIYEGIIKSE